MTCSRTGAARSALILITCMLGTMIAIVAGRVIYGLLIPAMLPELGLNHSDAGKLGAANGLGYLIGIAPVGVIASRIGERSSVVIGLAIGAITHAALAVASSFNWLVVLMFTLGVGSAFIYTPLLGLLGAIFPTRRGTALGIAGSGIGIGYLLAGALVPLAVVPENGGWRLVWVVLSVATLLTLCAVLIALPPRQSEQQGSVTALVSGYLLAWRSAQLRCTAILYASIGFAFAAHNLFVVSFAIENGISERLAGALVGAAGVLSILAGPALGVASDKWDRESLVRTAVLVSGAATLLLVAFPSSGVFVCYFAVIGLITFGLPPLVIAISTLQAASAQIPPPLAAGFVTLFYATGQVLSPALMGAIAGPSSGLRLVFLTVALGLLVATLPSFNASRRARLDSLQ